MGSIDIQKRTILDIEVLFVITNNVWFNATTMIENFNKKQGTKKDLSDFLKSSKAKGYISELEKGYDSVDSAEPAIMGYKQVINSPDEIGGTYVRLELGILLAEYLSIEFGRYVSEIAECKWHKKRPTDATKRSNETCTIGEFCKIVSSKIEDATLRANTCYTILRSMELVEKTSTCPSQKGISIYLDYRVHDYGYATLVYVDKADQLIEYMIRHLKEEYELNTSLNFPLGEF